MADQAVRCICGQIMYGEPQIRSELCLCGKPLRSRQPEWFFYVRIRVYLSDAERAKNTDLPQYIETLDSVHQHLRQAELDASLVTHGRRVAARDAIAGAEVMEIVEGVWARAAAGERRIEAAVVRKA